MLTDSTSWEGNPRLPATWRVLMAMLRHASLSQAELRETTGLSHPIIVQQVARLRRAGLIAFGQPIVGQPGRPPVPMSFNWRFRRLLTIDVHRAALTLQITDLAGAPLGDAQTTPTVSWTRDALTTSLVSTIRDTLLLPGPTWAAVGICLPALVSADGRVVREWPGCDDMRDFALGAYLSDACGVDVSLESSANVLAHMVATANPGKASSVVTVTLRHLPALQAGLLADGHLVRGVHDRAGDLSRLAVLDTACPASLSSFFSRDDAPRTEAVYALGCLLATLTSALDAEYAVVHVDERWQPAETDAIQGSLRSLGFDDSDRHLVLLEDNPAQTADTLLGMARAMSRRLLNLQTGTLARWVDDALEVISTPR